MVWSPLADGLLSGKYRRGQRPGEGRHLGEWDEPPLRDQQKLYDTVEVIVKIAEGHGVTPAQVSLAYLLTRPAVTTLVIGARKDSQLADNLKAAELRLGTEELAQLDEVSAPALIYPHWHQARTAADRLGPADRALHGLG
jgi:aryl-alcohol dehydrogenase-like predicted oxidoreductase